MEDNISIDRLNKDKLVKTIVEKSIKISSRCKGGAVEDWQAVIVIQETLRELGIITKSDDICTDADCFCGKYKEFDIMKNCDGGCMYPGA